MQTTKIGYEQIEEACKAVRAKTNAQPKVALTLGSGLGNYADEIEVEAEIPYGDIPHFPVSTVAGHDGKFVFGNIGSLPIVCMKGRVHFYEGYDTSEVVMPARLLKQLGVETMFLTNAAGGVNPSFSAGDLMLITDHVSLFAHNPLLGKNDERIGVRFPDMSHVYEPAFCDAVRQAAKENDIPLQEGVYCQLTGPSYETPAEIKLLQMLGVSAVGMSTAIEAIAARHAGMKVLGISCISNMAAGISAVPLSHKEVQETADRVAPLFTKLVTETLKAIG